MRTRTDTWAFVWIVAVFAVWYFWTIDYLLTTEPVTETYQPYQPSPWLDVGGPRPLP